MLSADHLRFTQALNDSGLAAYQVELVSMLEEKYTYPKHGHFEDWKEIVESLPDIKATDTDLSRYAPKIGCAEDITPELKDSLETKLKQLNPWRKGPFEFFGIYIDSEWRSDWKWSRISPHIQLENKLVLDVGCGNGYYALRMQAMGAKLVLGIDPSWHYMFQYNALQKYSSIEQRAFVLPFMLEEMPGMFNTFDSIFSMGVLYHRQEPQLHLKQIYSLLRDKGEFVLETLIIKDDDADVLIPNERYANMRNVWMIPSINLLKSWLESVGFVNIRVVDTTMTTIEEQRQTDWMTRYSLAQALDPDNANQTIEGYPAPLRAVVIANKAI